MQNHFWQSLIEDVELYRHGRKSFKWKKARFEDPREVELIGLI